MIERGLIVWLSLLCLAAYFWLDILAELGAGTWDPFVESRPGLFFLIALIMFCVGTLLPRDELWQVCRRWPTVLYGTALQYTTMPVLAYLFATFFVTDPDAQIGIIMIGCVPGAMASNVLTMLARGNTSYSVSLTTSATLLSPLVVPLVLYFFLKAHVTIDPFDAFLKLVMTVVGPVLLGHFLARSLASFAGVMRAWGPTIAHLSILWVIAVVVGLNRERLGQVQPDQIFALAAINGLGYLIGYGGGWLARMPEAMRRALTIEIGMQNAGLGTVLALGIFKDRPGVAILPAFYTFGCMLTGTILAQVWAWRGSAAEQDKSM